MITKMEAGGALVPTRPVEKAPSRRLRRGMFWGLGFGLSLGIAVWQGWKSADDVVNSAKSFYGTLVGLHPKPHLDELKKWLEEELKRHRPRECKANTPVRILPVQPVPKRVPDGKRNPEAPAQQELPDIWLETQRKTP